MQNMSSKDSFPLQQDLTEVFASIFVGTSLENQQTHTLSYQMFQSRVDWVKMKYEAEFLSFFQ